MNMEPTWMTLALLHCVLDVHSVLELQRAPLPPVGAFLLFAIFPGSSRVTSGQRLPSRDEEHFLYHLRHKEVFYDTRRLPDGRQMRVFLPKNETERFYFLIKDDETPLSFTITPCTIRPIHWRLLYQEYPTSHLRLDKHSDSVDELLLQGYEAPRHVGRRYVVFDTTLLGTRVKYTIGQTIPGLFTLEFVSAKSDVSLELFGTSSLEADPYPETPSSSEVTAVQIAERSMTLSWKPSPSDVVHGEDIEYCVAVNRKRNIRSHCAATTYHRGDRSMIPVHVGFGFPWEKKPRNVSIPSGRLDIDYTCVGRKTSFTLSALSPGVRYYFDVYAVNTRLNTSTAYSGRSVKVKPSRAKLLKEGKIRTAIISEQSARHFRFRLSQSGDLLVVVQPCGGEPVSVRITRNGRLLNSSMVANSGAIYFEYGSARRGAYLITVGPTLGGPTTVGVSYSRGALTSPYPILPADDSIHVDVNRTTCRSVTVSWAVSGRSDQRHCLYLQPTADRRQTELRPTPTPCPTRRPPKNRYKIRCVHLRAGHASVHRERVDNLRPNSRYAISVYVTRHSRLWLAYKPNNVSTNVSC